jgi:hypothetical protein
VCLLQIRTHVYYKYMCLLQIHMLITNTCILQIQMFITDTHVYTNTHDKYVYL